MVHLDGFEATLIEQFKQHPTLRGIELLSDTDFICVLLQRRFLSFTFTAMYDFAIDLLHDKTSIQIVRRILREEYPDSNGYSPSHREDLKDDLLQLGVTKKNIAETRPTQATLQTIERTISLVVGVELDEFTDLRLLTILRFWGEVLVSVEYGEYWRRIAKQLVTENKNRSRFYYPHYVHDAKKQPLAEVSSRSSTHADRLGVRLKQMLNSTQAEKCFMEMEQKIFQSRMEFYDQFVHMLSIEKS